MNIAVFGATGGTGLELVRLALAQGHTITAFVRDPSRLSFHVQALRSVVGDVLDADCVAQAVAHQVAVIVALGSSDRKERSVRSVGTANVIRAMQAAGGRRLVVVSAGGVGDSYGQAPLVLKLIIKTMLKNTYTDHEQQEQYVRASGLEWVIVRPAMLTNGPATGRFENGVSSIGLPEGKVARADVAGFLLQQLADDSNLGRAVSIP
jgi:putative NADH-flavin reductase